MKKILLAALAVLALFAMVACSDPTLDLSIESLKTAADKEAFENLTVTTWNWSETTSTESSTSTTTATFAKDGTLTLKDSSTGEAPTGAPTKFNVIKGVYYLNETASFEPTVSNPTYVLDGKKLTLSGIQGQGETIELTATSNNGIRGTWTCTQTETKDGTTTSVTYTIVIGKTAFDMLSETSVTIGTNTSKSSMLATFTYTDDSANKTLKLTQTDIYYGYTAQVETAKITLTGAKPGEESTTTITLTKNLADES